mgnify:CR=1 FL=1
MSLYADSSYPVRTDIENIHSDQFDQLRAPGTWGTSKQRLAIINEARQSAYRAGTLEKPINPGILSDFELSDVARRVVGRLAVSPKDMDQQFYNESIVLRGCRIFSVQYGRRRSRRGMCCTLSTALRQR